MKDSLNSSTSNHSATCSLCQDTLLRHIKQSKMFWYCPSCRQEMVCEEKQELPEPTLTSRLGQIAKNHRRLAKATEHSRRIGVRLS